MLIYSYSSASWSVTEHSIEQITHWHGAFQFSIIPTGKLPYLLASKWDVGVSGTCYFLLAFSFGCLLSILPTTTEQCRRNRRSKNVKHANVKRMTHDLGLGHFIVATTYLG